MILLAYYFPWNQFQSKVSFFGRTVQYLLTVLHFVSSGAAKDFRNLFCVSIVADLIGYLWVCFDIFEELLLYFREISFVLDVSVVEEWLMNVWRHDVVPKFFWEEFDFPYQFVVGVLFRRKFVCGVFYECLKLCFHFLLSLSVDVFVVNQRNPVVRVLLKWLMKIILRQT